MLIAVLLVVGLFGFDDKLRPLIKGIAESKATTICNKIISDDVAQLLAESGVDYSTLVEITRDENGMVTSVCTNMSKLNSFKSTLTSKIQQDISEYNSCYIHIPIGTIIGGDYFVGRGPNLSFHVEMSSNAICDIQSTFDDAGINQTRHQIMLNIDATVYIVIPWYKTNVELSTNFVIAETVIVGTVPEYFTRVDGSENVVDDINDYGYDVN